MVPSTGDQVELAFNPGHLYFFDASSGNRLIDREAVVRELEGPPRSGAMSLNEAQH
jgi:hypothetical protein